jgi:hypothetical protein
MAIDRLNPRSFEQEPAYVAGLLALLQGRAYEGDDGSVTFEVANINSIAPGAAEVWSGADLAVTARIQQGEQSVSKAILAQAKRGGLEDLTPSVRRGLVEQIRKMRRLTRSPKVLLLPDLEDGRRVPEIRSGIRIMDGLPTSPISLPDYFVRRILTTLDGDTRPEFVRGAQESSLPHLRVLATLHVP